MDKNSTNLKYNLEEILNDVNRYININKDRQRFANHFETLKEKLFTELRKNELFSYLFKGYQMGGSYGDNLKVTKPNEFDLVFHIKFPENNLVTVEEDKTLPGNVHLNLANVLLKIKNERQHQAKIPYLRKWLDEKDYLYVKKLQAFFESCFQKALMTMGHQITIKGETASLYYTKEGPAHTIHVTGRNNLKYSVDFVPGVLLKESQSVMSSHVGEWEAIPKPIPSLNYDHTSFRSSFYRQEQKVIANKKNLKNALRMMKKFRDSHLNLSKMKSYFIKTLFLWKAKNEKNPSYWEKSLTEIILDMFQAFENSLLHKKLPFFWDDRLNLYDNFSSSLFREMLRTVQAARKTLCEAAMGEITLPLQNRVYAIFLDSNEIKPKSIPTDFVVIPKIVDKDPIAFKVPKKQEESSCNVM